MDNKKKYFSDPLLRLVDQKNDLVLSFPDAKATINNGVLVWTGVVSPSPLSKEYTLKIEYRIGKNPIAWVINEKLNAETYMNIPHNYGVDLKSGAIKLCLFKPKQREWMKHFSIAKTIVPWAIEWLLFYEIWQVTGEWQGGGAHPSAKACKNSDLYREKSIES